MAFGISAGTWLVGGAALAGGYMSSQAAGDAADAQIQSTREANQTQLEMFNRAREDQKPWLDAGKNALTTLSGRIGLNGGSGDLMRSFGANDFQTDPGYQFRLSEGMKAINNSAAARGGLLSGATLKALSKYNQDFASNEYTNAFNRYQTNQTNQFNRLASLAGVGQTAANQNASNSMQTGQIIGNNTTSAGAARASGYVGSANAFTNGLSQGMNWWQNNQLLDKIGGTSGGYADEMNRLTMQAKLGG